MEELAVVVDAAEPRPRDELIAEDLAPDAVDLVALGEEAVAADVEPIALVLVGPADPADQVRVRLERDARVAVPGQLVGRGQPGRTRAGDHRGVRRDDRDRLGVVDLRPAMRGQGDAEFLQARRFGAHPGLQSFRGDFRRRMFVWMRRLLTLSAVGGGGVVAYFRRTVKREGRRLRRSQAGESGSTAMPLRVIDGAGAAVTGPGFPASA